MDENKKGAFNVATDITKELIALSTAIITLSVTFIDKILASNVTQKYSVFVIVALGLIAMSIICGFLVLSKFAGLLAKSNNPDIYDNTARFFSMSQMGSFLLGLILVLCFVGCSTCQNEQITKGGFTTNDLLNISPKHIYYNIEYDNSTKKNNKCNHCFHCTHSRK